MQKPSEKTGKLLLATEEELFAHIIGADHPFRRLSTILPFADLVEPLRPLYSDLGATGIDIEKGFKALLLQFWEDFSDREMEKALRENLAVKWFAGFSLTEPTPDFSYFSKLRRRIGAERIEAIFREVNRFLEVRGLVGNVFAFIDASAIVSKTALWDERDRAITDGEATLNNAIVSRYAHDPDARWGAKSKTNVWFGYKRHAAVDMRHGIITDTLVTPANVLDFQVLDRLCPDQQMVFMDKLYDVASAYGVLAAHRCHAATIKKNNRPDKRRDLDRWRSATRMPFEGTFSKLPKRARYVGIAKVAFQNVMASLAHNLKKAVRFLVPRPLIAPLPLPG